MKRILLGIGFIAALVAVRSTCGTASEGRRESRRNSVSASKVEIHYRRIRYSEASDRYIDFGWDYTPTEVIVYLPSAKRWEREYPSWAKGRRSEIIGEVKRVCDKEMVRKPIYEEEED